MSHFDAFFEEMLERDMRFCDELLNPYLQVHNELTDFFAKEAEIEQRCKRNNRAYVPNWEKYEELTNRYEEAMESTSTVVDKFELNINNNKENIPGTLGAITETPLPVATTAAGSSRPKRAAFLDASKTINKQVNLKLKEKLRREDVAAEATNKRTTIKTEKLSTTSKSDDDVAMPPPQSFPIKVRPNRRIKKERLEISVIPEDEESDCVVEVKKEHSKNSDIVLQEARVSLVDLTLAGSSQNNCFIGESSRDTYVLQNTTTNKQSTDKRTREDDNSVESNKRSKTNTPPINENLNGSGRTQYDDAVIHNNNENPNATFITESTVTRPNFQLNTTVILHKEPDMLLTDDESDQEPIQSNTKSTKTTKQVFSPYEQSPVKKKVEAFVKLGASSANATIRVTRTKTRVLDKQLQDISKQQPSTSSSVAPKLTNNVKEKAKFFSPTPVNKTKFEQVQEKRNARLQQLTAEKRRKEKLKDERDRKLLLEQEQKKQKLLQVEQKRLLTKQKAINTKQQQKPIYLRMKTPRLTTNDCYDSDEENYHKSKPQLSDWAQSAHLEDAQFTMAFCGEKIKNTFFSRCAQTVDLQDVFQTNNPKLLKRTSSAHWTVPPKYSILPKTLEISDEVFEEEEEE